MFAIVANMLTAFCFNCIHFETFQVVICQGEENTFQHDTSHFFLLKLYFMAAHLSKQRQGEAGLLCDSL